MLYLKKLLKLLLFRLSDFVNGSGSHFSYSQEGEDMILRRIFDGQPTGFYVDVGAHHPKRFSNTHYFYRLGWQGINIEPNPDMQRSFRVVRKRDINLPLGVAEQRGELTYYSFDEPALNTFDSALVEQRLSNTNYKVIRETVVPVMRLDEIFEQHVRADIPIDFLTIDVEGLDYAVLKSNNWQRFRPKVVLVEDLEHSLEAALGGNIHSFMSANGYRLIAKTFNTLFFEDRAIG